MTLIPQNLSIHSLNNAFVIPWLLVHSMQNFIVMKFLSHTLATVYPVNMDANVALDCSAIKE